MHAASDGTCGVCSNRAAAYTKLMAFPQGLDDCNKAIKMNPAFVKAYTRKGAIEFLMKDYKKALDTYGSGLRMEPENQECKDGLERTAAAINEVCILARLRLLLLLLLRFWYHPHHTTHTHTHTHTHTQLQSV